MSYNIPMPVDRMTRNRLAIYAGLLLLAGIPPLLAWKFAGPEHVFGGFLFNPIDGYTYLAKMRQGWQGDWRFTLPFSAQPGNGAYIYLFYLALGHIARLSTLPLQLVFHLARLLCAVFMVWSLGRFVERTLLVQSGISTVLILLVFGSGAGWLGVAAGLFTSDLWVSEAYPFLSAYNNPHFPLSLGLLVFLLTPDLATRNPAHQGIRGKDWMAGWRYGLGALALAELSPFGSVLAGLVCAFLAAWEQWDLRSFKPASIWVVRAAWIGSGAAPVLLYTWWAVQSDTALAGWNAQNLTPSPPWWDLVIALSPALPAAILGLVQALRQRQRSIRPVVVWTLAALSIAYLPLGLQRRFLIGIFIPISILGVYGLLQSTDRARTARLLVTGLIILSLPSNLVVLLAGWQGIASKDGRIYLSSDEVDGLAWLAAHTPRDSLVLANPESGLVIPAWTGRRVIYGHPFETVQAETELALVEDFFSGRLSAADAWQIVRERGIDLIYCSPHADCGQSATELLAMERLEEVYRNPGVRVLRVIREQSLLLYESEGKQ